MSGKRRLVGAGLLATVLAGAAAVAGAAPREIGRIFHEDPRSAGTVVRPAEAVLDAAIVRTPEAGAILHLENGWVLALAEGSAVRFEADGAGIVNVTVYAGQARAVSAGGRVLRAGQGSRFALPPREGSADPATAEARLRAARPSGGSPGRSGAARGGWRQH
jgi:hypothetical protein